MMSVVEQQTIAETDLVYQAKNGDANAYGVLYQRHFDAIYSYIYRRVTVVCEAEDLAQVVFLKAWQAIEDYQPSKTPFRGWLYRIAHNTVVDHYRTQKKNLQWEDLSTVADPSVAPESSLLEVERNETIRGALTTLHPSYREVITHRFIEEEDYAEIAEALDQKVNNVRVLQHRALSALRRALVQQSALWIATAATAIALFFSTTIVEAASYALPNERLYPVRTFMEDARLVLADDDADILLHTEFAERRIRDLHVLSREDRAEAMDETVEQLASHLNSASAKANRLPSVDSSGEERVTQVEDVLGELETSLAELEPGATHIVAEHVQSAQEAIEDARHVLHNDQSQSTIDHLPDDSSVNGQDDLPISTPDRQVHSTLAITSTVLNTPLLPNDHGIPEDDDGSVVGNRVAPPREQGVDASNTDARLAESQPEQDDRPAPSQANATGDAPIAGGESSEQLHERPLADLLNSTGSQQQPQSEAVNPQNRTESSGETSDTLPVPQDMDQAPDAGLDVQVDRLATEGSVVDNDTPDPMSAPDTPNRDASRTDVVSPDGEYHPATAPVADTLEQEQDESIKAPISSPADSEDAPRVASQTVTPSDRSEGTPPPTK